VPTRAGNSPARDSLGRENLAHSATACALLPVFLVGCVGLLAPPALAADSGSVPLRVEADGILSVSAFVNGAGPFNLLLDTGASRTLLTAGVARRLHLAPVAKSALVSPATSELRGVVRLDEVKLGNVVKRNLLVAVVDNAELEEVGEKFQGILGQDFLLDRDYTLDYEHRRLIWGASADEQTVDARLDLKEDEGRWLAALPQADHGTVLWFVPDSGAATLVVFDQGTPLTLPVLPMPSMSEVTTLAGSRRAKQVRIVTLMIGSAAICDRPALVMERRAVKAAGDGLLPLSMFASVSFHAMERSLVLRLR